MHEREREKKRVNTHTQSTLPFTVGKCDLDLSREKKNQKEEKESAHNAHRHINHRVKYIVIDSRAIHGDKRTRKLSEREKARERERERESHQ